ncbi:MAG: hypothetical protein AAF950_01930 [Pseudomonadota bacterium]
MDLINRFLEELAEETAFISSHLVRHWNGMGTNEQLYTLSMICAAGLLLALRKPRRVTQLGHDAHGQDVGIIKTVFLGGMLLLFISVGMQAAVNGIS